MDEEQACGKFMFVMTCSYCLYYWCRCLQSLSPPQLACSPRELLLRAHMHNMLTLEIMYLMPMHACVWVMPVILPDKDWRDAECVIFRESHDELDH